jgi:hypothetical protein
MKQTFKNKQTRLDEHSPDPIAEYEHIQSKLNYLAEVSSWNLDLNFIFSVAFVEMFVSDTPNYEISKGKFGATRSNWTYHTAMAIAQTCKMLNLTCKFEALGKRDAVIETKDDIPEIVLVAEWEWDYDDIFGQGKELDKLKASCKKSETAEGFLLIYCPLTKYLDHLQKIAEDWIGAMKSEETPPSLFLHTIIFNEKAGFREFDRLRTVEINPAAINVWNDRYF